MRLVRLLKQAVRGKRGQRALRIANRPKVRTFMCRRCGYLEHLEGFPYARGHDIPQEWGCLRCDSRTVQDAIHRWDATQTWTREDYERGKEWAPGIGELQDMTLLSRGRVYRALKALREGRFSPAPRQETSDGHCSVPGWSRGRSGGRGNPAKERREHEGL